MYTVKTRNLRPSICGPCEYAIGVVKYFSEGSENHLKGHVSNTAICNSVLLFKGSLILLKTNDFSSLPNKF